MENQEENFERRAKNINDSMTKEFMRIAIASIVGSSPIIDKFSTWLLAGCGATAALMVTNVNSITPFLGAFGFKIAMYLLIASAVIGLMQKYKAIVVQCLNEFTEKLLVGVNSLQTNHIESFEALRKEAKKNNVILHLKPIVDLESIKTEYTKLSPYIVRKRTIKNFEKGANDPLHGWRKLAVSFKWQIYYLILQVLLFFCFLLIAALSVGKNYIT